MTSTWMKQVRYVMLGGVKLRGTASRNATSRDATLRDATLRDATLNDVSLRDAMLHYATLRCVALGYFYYVTLRSVTLCRYVMLCYVTLCCASRQHDMLCCVAIRYVQGHKVLRYVRIGFVGLHIMIHFLPWRFVTLRFVTLHFVTLRFVTLRFFHVSLLFVALCRVTLPCGAYVMLRCTTLLVTKCYHPHPNNFYWTTENYDDEWYMIERERFLKFEHEWISSI